MSKISVKIKNYCDSKGIRCPLKKLLVADCLQQVNGFVDAANLYLLLRNGCVKVSHATVYQSLNWLTEIGFAECKELESKNLYRILH